MSERLIHAFTEPGTDYPPYINASRIADGSVRVLLRGSNAAGGPSAEMVLSEADWRSFVWSVYSETEDYMREHGRPVAMHGSGRP